jgi:hypothetical protein
MTNAISHRQTQKRPWDIRQIRASDNQRQITTDMKTGITTLEIIDDFGAVEDQQHGMVSGSVAREWWSIHPDDPLSAHGKTHWTEERRPRRLDHTDRGLCRNDK